MSGNGCKSTIQIYYKMRKKNPFRAMRQSLFLSVWVCVGLPGRLVPSSCGVAARRAKPQAQRAKSEALREAWSVANLDVGVTRPSARIEFSQLSQLRHGISGYLRKKAWKS